MDARTENRIEELYRNAKQMPLLTVLGLLVPIVLLFAVPLGIVYFIECSRLVNGINTGRITLPSGRGTEHQARHVSDRVFYLEGRKFVFLLPCLLVAAWGVLAAIVVIRYSL